MDTIGSLPKEARRVGPGPVSLSNAIKRRDFLKAGFAGAVASVMGGIARGQEHGFSGSIENHRVFEAMHNLPFASMETLESPPENLATVQVRTQNGIFRYETLHHLHEVGRLEEIRLSRRSNQGVMESPLTPDEVAKEPDVFDCLGSGFAVTGSDGHAYIFSNEHVTRGTHRDFEAVMTTDFARDLAVSTDEMAMRCPGDQFPVPMSTIDPKVCSNDLPQHEVSITGFGADLFRFQGHPFRAQSIVSQECADRVSPHSMILKVRMDDIRQPERMMGISGTPVTIPNGNVAGVVWGIYLCPALRDSLFILFTGPEDLRNVAKQATVDRAMNAEKLKFMDVFLQAFGTN
jgi:hypothetical protein